jgi:ABC-2 type transport system permease protein
VCRQETFSSLTRRIGPKILRYTLSRRLFIQPGAYLAISCITSAMTRNQVISFIISVVICLFFILAGFPPIIHMLEGWAKPWLVDTIASFSVITHFDGFQKGVLDSRDVLFFLSLIGFSLFATSVILRGHRAG